jgi:hypothetical protein
VDPLQRIAEVSAAAVAAGINPWLAALTLVGLSALGFVDPGTIPLIDSELADPSILAALVTAFLIEQVADKIPGVDHISDLVHLPIKPVAAVALATAIASPEDASNLGAYMVPTGIAAAGLALLAHFGKASVRGGSTATTGGLANPFLSVLEDVGVVVLIVLAVVLPVIALTLVALTLYWSARGIAALVRGRRARHTA